jgi:uncharacterized repeat protein (TIGR03803 family)
MVFRNLAAHAGRFRAHLLPIVIAAGAASATWSCADAASVKVLYSFCAKASCTDGSTPWPVTRDAAGNFYGATELGGDGHAGVVFELAIDSSGKKWKYKRLYSFCHNGNCADGSQPYSALVLDQAGDLYGVTQFGGAHNQGVAFELAIESGKRKLQVLYSFCKAVACADGDVPRSSLTYAGASTGALYDGTSPLFGVSNVGGAFGQGTVFSLTPPSGARKWSEKVLYSFCALSACADGSDPVEASLLVDDQNNLFGTTVHGGDPTSNVGVVFELKPNAKRTKWTETVLHTFCVATCQDGASPAGGFAVDSSGSIFGVTSAGGAHSGGVLYKLVPNGENSQQTVLHDFCAEGFCADGSGPQPSPLLDSAGTLHGVTQAGGASNNGGVIYELGSGGYNVDYSFCAQANCADGQLPVGGLIADGSGKLFGSTFQGGANGGGTVFEFTP